MDEVIKKALRVKDLYTKLNIKENRNVWGYREHTEALVSDSADLMKLIMIKDNLRSAKTDDNDSAIAHELADCLWSIIAISKELNIDLETIFNESMDKLEKRVSDSLNN